MPCSLGAHNKLVAAVVVGSVSAAEASESCRLEAEVLVRFDSDPLD